MSLAENLVSVSVVVEAGEQCHILVNCHHVFWSSKSWGRVRDCC